MNYEMLLSQADQNIIQSWKNDDRELHHDVAVGILTDIINKYRTANPAILKRGVAELQFGNIDNAMLDFSTVTSTQPELEIGHVLLAKAYMGIRDYENAKEVASNAINLNKNSFHGRIIRAHAEKAMGNLDNSKIDLSYALNKNKSPILDASYGDMFAEMGFEGLAYSHYNAALKSSWEHRLNGFQGEPFELGEKVFGILRAEKGLSKLGEKIYFSFYKHLVNKKGISPEFINNYFKHFR